MKKKFQGDIEVLRVADTYRINNSFLNLTLTGNTYDIKFYDPNYIHVNNTGNSIINLPETGITESWSVSIYNSSASTSNLTVTANTFNYKLPVIIECDKLYKFIRDVDYWIYIKDINDVFIPSVSGFLETEIYVNYTGNTTENINYLTGTTLPKTYWGVNGNDIISGNTLGTNNNFDLNFKTSGITNFGINVNSELTKYNKPILDLKNNSIFLGNDNNYNYKQSRVVYIGDNAGQNNTYTIGPVDNVAIGYKSLNGSGQTTNPYQNITIGSFAGEIGGFYESIAIGFKSLQNGNNVTLYRNIAIGNNSMVNKNVGARNIGIGDNTFLNNNGNDNVVLGNASFTLDTNSNNNIIIGNSSANSNTPSTNNSIIIGNSIYNTIKYNNYLNIADSLFGENIYSENSKFSINVISGITATLQLKSKTGDTSFLIQNELNQDILKISGNSDIYLPTLTGTSINVIGINQNGLLNRYNIDFFISGTTSLNNYLTRNNFNTYSAYTINYVSGFTPGSILFASSGGTITQKNSNLFWDNSNNRIGIGTSVPSQLVEVFDNTASSSFGSYPTIQINNPNANGYAQYTLSKGTAVTQVTSRWLMDNLGNIFFGTYVNGKDLVIQTVNAERFRVLGSGINNGFIGVNTFNPTYRFEIKSATSNENIFLTRTSTLSRILEITENSSNVGSILMHSAGNEGYVSIGSTGGVYKLQIRGHNANANIFSTELANGTKILEMRGSGTTSSIGFWNRTPASAQTLNSYITSAITSTYIGIDNTQPGLVYATVNDLNNLRVAYENLRKSYDDLRTKLINTTLLI